MVAQHPVLFSTSVYKNIEFGLKIRKISAAKREQIIDEAFAQVDLSAFKQEPVQGLSGGEIQRIALARALALSPRVLLCDEPTSSVDVENQAAIIAILKEMNSDRNISIIFTSHDRLQAAALAHHTLILEQGSLVTADLENIFPCTIITTADNRIQICLAKRTCFDLSARETDLKPGKTRIALDPAGIILLNRQRVGDQTGEPDILKGRIVQLMAQGDRVRMTVDTGVLLTVLPDPASYQQVAPSIGDRVYLRVPVEAIRSFTSLS
jgi:tungstate transport system ATP-binding protein